MRYRLEKDTLGERQLPAEAYYGIHTLRSKEAFQITKHGICRQMIKAFAIIKKSSAQANCDLGRMSKEKAEAISLSSDEILNGRLHGQFVTDVLQGGGGISMNMNACEVIANRANEMLKSEKGNYDVVSPIIDLNLNQTPSEVVLLAGKMSAVRLTKKLLTELKKLINAFQDLSKKSENCKDELTFFYKSLERYYKLLDNVKDGLLEIGSINSNPSDAIYNKKFVKYLSQYTSEAFFLSKNPDIVSFNLDHFNILSSTLQSLISNLSKTANDIKYLSSEGKIVLPKVIDNTDNDEAVLELVKQVSYYTMGNDLTISRAVEDGKMDKNNYQPIIYACLFESINLIRRTIRTLREELIEKVK